MSSATISATSATSIIRPLQIRPAVDVEPGVLTELELDRLYAEAAIGHPAGGQRCIQSCLAVDFPNRKRRRLLRTAGDSAGPAARPVGLGAGDGRGDAGAWGALANPSSSRGR